jgi:hypothetical protein
VESGRSRETALRSDLAGWAEHGYCASHSRYFWGLRLHLLCTLHGLPVGFVLTGAKADERQALLDILADPGLATVLPGQILLGDKKNYYDRDFEAALGPGNAMPRHAQGRGVGVRVVEGLQRLGRCGGKLHVLAGVPVPDRDGHRAGTLVPEQCDVGPAAHVAGELAQRRIGEAGGWHVMLQRFDGQFSETRRTPAPPRVILPGTGGASNGAAFSPVFGLPAPILGLIRCAALSHPVQETGATGPNAADRTGAQVLK